MTPSIELSPKTFGRLQSLAVPLVDTIETVINRLIDSYERSPVDVRNPVGPREHSNARSFNPNAAPDLTHSKVLGIVLDGQPLGQGKDNWNGLLNATVRLAKVKAKNSAEFKNLVVVKFVEGVKTDEGYRYLPDLGISLQGQDANGAWRGSVHIARQLGCDLSVTFAWREKEGASHPGVTGQLSIPAR